MNSVILLNQISFNMSVEAIMHRSNIPLKFSDCTFENYIPNLEYPSQREVKEKLITSVRVIEKFNKKNGLNGLFKSNAKPKNIYIDGGFGVGKTHLLASIINSYRGSSLFISFSELMYLIAYFNLLPTVEKLSKFDLVLLDEFELDDPGDAMMGINFVRELNKTNSIIITTSNTTPTNLGGRKFDILVFKERIGKLADYFNLFVIDGEDYRVSKHPRIEYNASHKTLRDLYNEYKVKNRKKLYVKFDELISRLSDVHPVRYMNFNNTVDAIFIENLRKFTDDELLDVLRFIYLTEVIYYGSIDIFISTNIDLWDIFSDDLKNGKFKTKIMRCLSRISEKGVLVRT